MKKVLFLVNTMGQAGAETALIALFKKLLDRKEYDLSLYALIPRGEMFDKVPEQVHIVNRRYGNGSVLSAAGRFMIFCRMAKAFFYRMTGFRMLPSLIRNYRFQKSNGRVQYDKLLWRLLAEGTPALPDTYDLAVAYIEGASVYYLADRVKAKRKASFLHIDYTAAGYHPMMDQNCYDRIDRIFVVSSEAGRRFADVYPQHAGKISLFRNIVDRDAVLARAEAGEGPQDDFTGTRFVSVGRLAVQKGYDIAVQAMAKVIADGYNARWYVIGEGPERKPLEQLIAQTGMQEHFLLLGAKDNPYPYILGADLYVQPSRFEGWGIAVEEALILKKPVLATNCTGIAEQIETGVNGILCPIGAEQLARQLEWLMDNPRELRALATGTLSQNGEQADGLAQLLSMID
jgi:glycosyltransferase involved in cell wall biosynthesis